jgi:hypothetical protein
MVVLRGILILSSYLCLGLSRGLIPLDFHPNVCLHLFSLPCTTLAYPFGTTVLLRQNNSKGAAEFLI